MPVKSTIFMLSFDILSLRTSSQQTSKLSCISCWLCCMFSHTSMHPRQACTLPHAPPVNFHFSTLRLELAYKSRSTACQVRNAAEHQVLTHVQPSVSDEEERAQACMQDLLQLYKIDDVQKLVRLPVLPWSCMARPPGLSSVMTISDGFICSVWLLPPAVATDNCRKSYGFCKSFDGQDV